MSDEARQHSKVEVEFVIIRCGCGAPESHPHSVCPAPRQVEDWGIVSYDNRNPLRRAAWRMSRYWRDRIRHQPFTILKEEP